MANTQLKDVLINRISEISDDSFLKEILTFLDSKAGNDVLQLTREQLDDITTSRIETEKGSFITNKILKKEVMRWLKSR